MTSTSTRFLPVKICVACLVVVMAANASALDAPGEAAVQFLETRDGVGFALLGDKPTRPAPTLLVFATDARTSLATPAYLQAGITLRQQGWLCVSLDLPCHGAQHLAGEPEGLPGWRHRIDHGDDPMADLVNRVRRVLDYLVAEKYSDAATIAVCGTSRGGFSALHVAAAEPRVRAVAAYAPVSDLKALSEFQGAEEAPLVRKLALVNSAEKLSERGVWITIGDRDLRVGTDLAIALARAISVAAVAKNLPGQVELHVCPSPGHGTPAGAGQQSAAWILQTLAAKIDK